MYTSSFDQILIQALLTISSQIWISSSPVLDKRETWDEVLRGWDGLCLLYVRPCVEAVDVLEMAGPERFLHDYGRSFLTQRFAAVMRFPCSLRLSINVRFSFLWFCSTLGLLIIWKISLGYLWKDSRSRAMSVYPRLFRSWLTFRFKQLVGVLEEDFLESATWPKSLRV